jgi:toxin YoeB
MIYYHYVLTNKESPNNKLNNTTIPGMEEVLLQSSKELLKVIRDNLFQNSPKYEALKGKLRAMYSRRISIQHRIVYEVYKEEKVAKILSMWSHNENI